MSYIKAEDILPREVLELVWQYVDGATLYIPRKSENRRNWGDGTAYRTELSERNRRIRDDFAQGMRVSELAEEYHLSPKSISRILRSK